MFSTWIVHLHFKGHLLWALSIHLPFAYISQIHPQGDLQRIRGYFTESLSLLPFPDNKVVIISCRAHPRERVFGDLERSCHSFSDHVCCCSGHCVLHSSLSAPCSALSRAHWRTWWEWGHVSACTSKSSRQAHLFPTFQRNKPHGAWL